jgi:hypothetical protein
MTSEVRNKRWQRPRKKRKQEVKRSRIFSIGAFGPIFLGPIVLASHMSM